MAINLFGLLVCYLVFALLLLYTIVGRALSTLYLTMRIMLWQFGLFIHARRVQISREGLGSTSTSALFTL